MRFSKKSEYALRALLELTRHEGDTPLRRHDLAERQAIPLGFLESILLTLKSAGYIVSRRGAAGGYALLKRPEAVTLGAVIRLMDGPLAPIGCVSQTAYRKCEDCPYVDSQACPIQEVMLKVRNAMAEILDHYTLKDFAKRAGRPVARKTRNRTRSRASQ